MEWPMVALRQHQIEIAVAVQIAQAGVGRSLSSLLKLDGTRKLPSHHGTWDRGETARDSVKNQTAADFQHQFLLKHRWKLEPFLYKTWKCDCGNLRSEHYQGSVRQIAEPAQARSSVGN